MSRRNWSKSGRVNDESRKRIMKVLSILPFVSSVRKFIDCIVLGLCLVEGNTFLLLNCSSFQPFLTSDH